MPFFISLVWAEWGEWSKCSKSCGGGSRKRVRDCENHNSGQKSCEERHTDTSDEENEECNTDVCEPGELLPKFKYDNLRSKKLCLLNFVLMT